MIDLNTNDILLWLLSLGSILSLGTFFRLIVGQAAISTILNNSGNISNGASLTNVATGRANKSILCIFPIVVFIASMLALLTTSETIAQMFIFSIFIGTLTFCFLFFFYRREKLQLTQSALPRIRFWHLLPLGVSLALGLANCSIGLAKWGERAQDAGKHWHIEFVYR